MAKRKKAQSEDGLLVFILGLLAGLAGGALIGILLAPKSGDELREDVQSFAKKLPGAINEEINNPRGKTREFIEKTRYSIENQVNQVREGRQADRMAKAKLAEETASGYEYH